MQSIFGSIFSCCLFICTWSFAQQDAPQNQEQVQEPKPVKKAPKPPKDYRPTGIRFGTDLIDIIKSNTQKNFSGWEINADVDLANYYLVMDVGNWARDLTLPNGEYINGGNYYRIGADINFLQKDPDHNMFFLGFRYGHSSFHETLSYQETDAL